jgi:hypothetical protein
MDEESPCLSEYESECFLSRRKENSKQALAKKGIFQRAKPTTVRSTMAVSKRANAKMPIVKRLDITSAKTSNSSNDEDDVVPFSALMKRKDVGEVKVALPLGETCIGLEVVRDFGGSHGVCKGNVVSVDSNRRRPLPYLIRRRRRRGL